MDPSLEEDWKHVLTQITKMMFDSDEIIDKLPFDVDLETCENIADLISIGCSIPKKHPLFKWITKMMSAE